MVGCTRAFIVRPIYGVAAAKSNLDFHGKGRDRSKTNNEPSKARASLTAFGPSHSSSGRRKRRGRTEASCSEMAGELRWWGEVGDGRNFPAARDFGAVSLLSVQWI
jgi:hypothetical protein